ncbi:MAG: D-sedoheptulose 7-phosphate isomerase [Proteobacteria bacterium]|nr:D-sedoheptulose 7-phosphate isomerase [Pseudomonadota bacterium]
MDARTFFLSELDEHDGVLKRCRETLASDFEAILRVWVGAIQQGGKILFFGNGGSAADAQHLATELSVRYHKNRKAIAAVALTTDSSALTAAGNDLGFEHIFARQIEALGRPGDVAVGISTSGRSPNVLAALKTARAMKLVPVAFGGGDGGSLRALSDVALIVPSATTSRIQEMHIALGQMLCGALEIELGLA